MVASHKMRAIRDLPLAASLGLTGAALFFGGGSLDGSLPWLGGGALLAVLASLLLVGVPAGLATLVPLGALTAWLAVSAAWSTLPDRSWVYANRAFVYTLFALLGLWLAPRTRALALGLAALLGLVAVWALAGKVLPPLYDYGPPGLARLRAPVGLWNQLALLGAFALPLALWRRRLEGTLLAYVWLVAIALTGSRGGAAVAAIVVLVWFVFGEERIAAAAALVAAAVPAVVVAGIAFTLPGVTSDGQSLHVRWHDGLVFGALLVAGGVAAALLARIAPPRDTRALRRAAFALGALAVAALLVVGVLKAGSAWRSFTSSAQVTNTSVRFTSAASNYRWVWWRQAWRGFEHHALAGTGAGSFHLTNLHYRTSYLDETIEPHDLPLQMLSETGLVGFALFAAAALTLLVRGHGRKGPELALALILPAYLLHALVDVDWDFAAVSVPAFLAAGAIAGRRGAGAPRVRLRGARRRRRSPARLRRVAPTLARLAVGDRRARGPAGSRDHARQACARSRSVPRRAVLGPGLRRRRAQPGPARVRLLHGRDSAATCQSGDLAARGALRARAGLRADRLPAARALHGARQPARATRRGRDDYRRALALVNSGKPRC